MAEEYVGVKFKTLIKGLDSPYGGERVKLLNALKELKQKELLHKNEGNLSIKVPEGFIITPTGKDMDKITTDDLVLVDSIDLNKHVVASYGSLPPSSESVMHWLIYETFPKVRAIIHFHDDSLLEKHEKFTETEKAFPYGTVELAHEVIKTLKNGKFIILKDHGALAVGKDLSGCMKLIERAKKT